MAPVFHDDEGDEITAVFDAVQAIVLRQRAIGQKLLVSSRVFETAAEAILITNDQGRIADVNAALLRMTGYPREELIGQPAGLLYRLQETSHEGVNIGEAVRQHGEWRGETFFLTRDQRPIPVMLAVSALFDEQQQSLGNVAIFSDISALKLAEDRLRDLSYKDPLTGLPNYRAFAELMHTQLRPDNAHAHRFALLFIDLDHLKLINDSYGHEQGDQVIVQIAQNLSRFLPQPHFLCRRSGDEFIAILYMQDNVAGMQQKLNDSMQTVTHRIELPGGVLTQASFSVGAVVYPDHAQTLNELLVLADSALQSSKEAGRARVTWLNNDIILRLTRRHRIEARLAEALGLQQPVRDTGGMDLTQRPLMQHLASDLLPLLAAGPAHRLEGAIGLGRDAPAEVFQLNAHAGASEEKRPCHAPAQPGREPRLLPAGLHPRPARRPVLSGAVPDHGRIPAHR